MSKHNVSKILAVTMALTFASAGAHAESADKRATKGQKIGMASGVAIGALVGGPFGAAAGFIVGSITGASVGAAKDATAMSQSFEKQLANARNEFAQLSASKQSEHNSMVEQLAQRLHADVLFRTASAELDSVSAQKLMDLGTVLSAYPDLTVEIDGYADPRGKSGSNDELSQRRVSAVRAALVAGGASSDKIKSSAHGEKLSTATKDDLEAYAWERRVSLSVLAPTATSPSQVAQAK